MRLLIVSDTYPPDINGAAIFASRLGHGLASQEHDVHQIAPAATQPNLSSDAPDMRVVYRIPSLSYPWHPDFRVAEPAAAYRTVSRIMDTVRPDVVHVQAHFVIGRAAIRAAWRRHLPLVATNHFMPENLEVQLPFHIPPSLSTRLRSFAWADLKRTYGRSDVITAPTSYAARLFEERTGIFGVRVISNGVKLRSSEINLPPRKPVVLYVGRLDPEKRVDELITAMKWVDAPLRLRIVGDGISVEALRSRARYENVADRVDFLGRVSDELLATELAQASVFCMPSQAELQSIASLEAMAAGLPVIGARATALPELVRPGVNGLLYESGNPVQLAENINRVAGNDSLRKRMSLCARETAELHDSRDTVNRFEALYLEVIDTRRLERFSACETS